MQCMRALTHRPHPWPPTCWSAACHKHKAYHHEGVGTAALVCATSSQLERGRPSGAHAAWCWPLSGAHASALESVENTKHASRCALKSASKVCHGPWNQSSGSKACSPAFAHIGAGPRRPTPRWQRRAARTSVAPAAGVQRLQALDNLARGRPVRGVQAAQLLDQLHDGRRRLVRHSAVTQTDRNLGHAGASRNTNVMRMLAALSLTELSSSVISSAMPLTPRPSTPNRESVKEGKKQAWRHGGDHVGADSWGCASWLSRYTIRAAAAARSLSGLCGRKGLLVNKKEQQILALRTKCTSLFGPLNKRRDCRGRKERGSGLSISGSPYQTHVTRRGLRACCEARGAQTICTPLLSTFAGHELERI